MTKKNKNNYNKGQTIILIVVMMGGILLTATTIAGLLMFYQVQQSNDFSKSTQAVYAADAGLERAIYYYYNEYKYDPDELCYPMKKACLVPGGIPFTTDSSYEAKMIIPPPGSDSGVNVFISTGKNEEARRVLQTKFLVSPFVNPS
ncbi:MAG TPA: hypothetical protein VKO61_01725 [Candidatus Paceibacterota bacterium]|nr:hypothetical protein [Candidatus Paceibacterota bacterium]